MIRMIVAIDKNRGMADEHGIPWQGMLPSDVKHFREKTVHSNVLMGYGTYVEFENPLSDRKNFVATKEHSNLKPGFDQIEDAITFANNFSDDLWIIGGAGLFAATLETADELHITQLDGDFHCTKFFPAFEQDFEKVNESEPATENNITFRFQVWRRKLA